MRLLGVSRSSCFAITFANRLQRRNLQGATRVMMSGGDYSSMHPPLFDVDCNLFHRDFKSLQKKDDSDTNPWSLLEEDSIDAANIEAMLSPASTIEEAKIGLDTLINNPPPLVVKTTGTEQRSYILTNIIVIELYFSLLF
jgi:hypothetical protein